MSVIGICGSPREGNSTQALEKVLDYIDEDSVEIIKLKDQTINYCDGCLKCEETKSCHQNDDMQQIYDKLRQSETIILATPDYFDNVSGLLKNFIDRLNPICTELGGKKIGVIVSGQLEGEEGKESRREVIRYLKNLSKIFEMEFIGSLEFSVREKNDINQVESIEEKCSKFAQKI